MVERKKEITPTLNAKGVAHLLNCSIVWVHNLTRRSAEYGDNRLQGYIMNEEGTAWVPKVGRGVNGAEVMYDREEVEAYRKAHPDVEARVKEVTFTSGEEQLIIDLATPEYSERGYVTRTNVLKAAQAMSLDELAPYGIDKKSDLRNIVWYPKIMAVAQKHEWPLPPRQRKNTAAKRAR